MIVLSFITSAMSPLLFSIAPALEKSLNLPEHTIFWLVYGPVVGAVVLGSIALLKEKFSRKRVTPESPSKI